MRIYWENAYVVFHIVPGSINNYYFMNDINNTRLMENWGLKMACQHSNLFLSGGASESSSYRFLLDTFK